MRGDAEFIRLIEKMYGLDAAKAMQQRPYIEIGHELSESKIIPYILNDTNKAEEKVETAKFALEHLPWSSFVMKFPTYVFPEKNFQVGGFFVATGKTGVDKSHTEVIFCPSFMVDDALTLLRPEFISMTADTFRFERSETADLFGLGQFVAKDAVFETFRSMYVYAMSCLAYLALCPERLVSVRSTDPINRQTRKRIAKDISERPDLATHILIDPSQAPKYQPPALRAITEALGQKVVPHRRRSHWRRLPDKVVRVRESWIGTKEWTHQGRAYKVVSPPGDREVDRD